MITFVFDTKEECDKFTYLYNKYYKIVFYTILRFIEDKFLAEDILNEVYILIGKNLAKVDCNTPTRCQNYIITITRNYCKSYLRKQNKIHENLIDNCDESKSNMNDVLEDLIEKEQFDYLMAALNQLDDKYKMVLELKYINGFHDDEIANFLGIKKKNVQMRLYRAKMMLWKGLGSK